MHTEGSNTVMEHVLRLVREAATLDEFVRALVRLEALLRPDDAVLLTADYGNDPTHLATTDYTREYVPILATCPRVVAGVALGTRQSFADVGATVEELLGLAPRGPGESFAAELQGQHTRPAVLDDGATRRRVADSPPRSQLPAGHLGA